MGLVPMSPIPWFSSFCSQKALYPSTFYCLLHHGLTAALVHTTWNKTQDSDRYECVLIVRLNFAEDCTPAISGDSTKQVHRYKVPRPLHMLLRTLVPPRTPLVMLWLAILRSVILPDMPRPFNHFQVQRCFTVPTTISRGTSGMVPSCISFVRSETVMKNLKCVLRPSASDILTNSPLPYNL